MKKILLMLLSLSFLSCTKKTAAPTEIRIGTFGALSGSESSFGTETERGIRLAVEEQNALGGVRGLPVRLISYDNEGKTDVTMTAVTRLITQDKVHLLIGESASARSLAAGQLAQQYKIPLIATSATHPSVTQAGDYVFRVCIVDDFQAEVAANFVRHDLGLKSVAILHDIQTDYSVNLAKLFSKLFQEMGGSITGDFSYTGGDLDFKSQLTAIRQQKPEALFVPGYYTEAGIITRQARELGLKQPIIGGDGWDSPSVFQIAQRAAVGAYLVNLYAPDDPQPSIKEFIEKYRKRFDNRVAMASAVTGYEAAKLAFDAMNRAGSSEPAAVREALAKTQGFPAIIGPISITAERNARRPAVILTIAEDGNFRFFKRFEPKS